MKKPNNDYLLVEAVAGNSILTAIGIFDIPTVKADQVHDLDLVRVISQKKLEFLIKREKIEGKKIKSPIIKFTLKPRINRKKSEA